MERNHIKVIGPKNFPMTAEPCLCTAKRATKIPILIGMMNRSKAGVAMERPSTAESTEIAGVIIPSPKNKEAPTKPKIIIINFCNNSCSP